MAQAADPMNDDVPTITRDEIVRRQGDRRLILVHVLPAASFAERRIPGSRNLPAAEITARAGAVLPDRTADIAAYCGSFT